MNRIPTAVSAVLVVLAVALAGCTESDEAAVKRQRVCPVTGERLGLTPAPHVRVAQVVEVRGRLVWVCCDGCKKKLLADPDKYFTRLDP